MSETGVKGDSTSLPWSKPFLLRLLLVSLSLGPGLQSLRRSTQGYSLGRLYTLPVRPPLRPPDVTGTRGAPVPSPSHPPRQVCPVRLRLRLRLSPCEITPTSLYVRRIPSPVEKRRSDVEDRRRSDLFPKQGTSVECVHTGTLRSKELNDGRVVVVLLLPTPRPRTSDRGSRKEV